MTESQNRRETRYRGKEGALAFHGSIIGQIIDVSRGGIAFQYVAINEEQPPPAPLYIIFRKYSFYLYDLHAQEIYDHPIHEGLSFHRLSIRRRGLAFAKLTAPQSSALADFIENHTLAPV